MNRSKFKQWLYKHGIPAFNLYMEKRNLQEPIEGHDKGVDAKQEKLSGRNPSKVLVDEIHTRGTT